MQAKAAITVLGSPEEIEQLWRTRQQIEGQVSFRRAPGDRGTEIHVEISKRGPFGAAAQGRVKDELRAFKAEVETGVEPRSEASPEGHQQSKQQPAQAVA